MDTWGLFSKPEAITFIMGCNWQSQKQELKSALKKNLFQIHLYVWETKFLKEKEEEWQKKDICIGYVSDSGATVKEQFKTYRAVQLRSGRKESAHRV